MHSNFSMAYNSLLLLSLFISMLSLSQIWLVAATFSWILHPSDMSPSFFEQFLTYCHRIFQHHVVISPSKPWNQPFLLCSGKWYFAIKIWVLYVPLSTGELLFPNPLCRQSCWAHTCVCTSLTFMFISVSASWKPCIYTNTWCFIPIPV